MSAEDTGTPRADDVTFKPDGYVNECVTADFACTADAVEVKVLREKIKAIEAVNVNEFGGKADLAISRLIESIPSAIDSAMGKADRPSGEVPWPQPAATEDERIAWETREADKQFVETAFPTGMAEPASRAIPITPDTVVPWPCWLYHFIISGTPFIWKRYETDPGRLAMYFVTHYHPDQPTPPTCRPTGEAQSLSDLT